jgi:hypothetical protein
MTTSQADRAELLHRPESTGFAGRIGDSGLALRIPAKSAGDSGLMSATHSDLSRPAVPIDVGRGGIARGLG